MEENNTEDQGLKNLIDMFNLDPDVMDRITIEKLEKGYFNLNSIEIMASRVVFDVMVESISPSMKALFSFIMSILVN